MRKKFIFIGSSKGGVGKTLTAKALVEFLRGRTKSDGSPLDVAVYDTDPNVGQLARAYGVKSADGSYDEDTNDLQPFAGVMKFDARADSDKFSDALDSQADIVVMDMPGGLVDMSHVFGSMEQMKNELAKEEYEIIVMNVIAQLKPSAMSVNLMMDAWGDGPRYVAVKNLGFGDSDDFFFFDGPSAHKASFPAKRLLEQGGAVIELPAIDGGVIGLLDDWEVPLGEAAKRLSEDRGAVSGWRRRHLSLENFIAKSASGFEQLRLLD